jgi:hypothetical protein
MNCHPSRWFANLAFGLALAALPASAQQPIQYTKPPDPQLATKANNFLPSAGDHNAPSSIFNLNPSVGSFDVLPTGPSPRPISPNQADQWQHLLDDKKNWMLLTPSEIMGVPTPEKILGLPDPDARLSAEQRYLNRQERQSAFMATNSLSRPEGYLGDKKDNYPLHPMDANDALGRSRSDMNPDSAKYYKQLLKAKSDSPFGSDQRTDASMDNPFGFAAPPPKPTPDQLANRERFRALLEPDSPPDKLPQATHFAAPVLAAPDPFLDQQPKINPAGRSFSELDSGINRPAGLKPLPGITGSSTPTTTKSSSTAAKLPPWLDDSASLFTQPQRKF